MVFLSTQDGQTDSFSRHLEEIRRHTADDLAFHLASYLREKGVGNLPLRADTAACFLFQDSAADSVAVAGDFNGWNPKADFLSRIEGTDLFYLSKAFESDARLDYKFVVDGKEWILDPLNPRTVTGGFGSNSELAMPGYADPEEILYRPDIPHGRVEAFAFPDSSKKNAHVVQIYFPPGYDSGSARYPTLYVQDGSEYILLGGMVNVLDDLIHKKAIEPVVAVFIDPNDRNREYAFYAPYQSLVCDSLVPYIDGCYRTEKSPERRGIMGCSLGGLVSLDIALQRPDLFGFCGSQSGAFWVQDARIVQLVREKEAASLRLYLDWGTYETQILEVHHTLRDVFHERGNALRALEFHEGHSWGSWRAHVDELLKFFISK